jgi:hypothetical protein
MSAVIAIFNQSLFSFLVAVIIAQKSIYVLQM